MQSTTIIISGTDYEFNVHLSTILHDLYGNTESVDEIIHPRSQGEQTSVFYVF